MDRLSNAKAKILVLKLSSSDYYPYIEKNTLLWKDQDDSMNKECPTNLPDDKEWEIMGFANCIDDDGWEQIIEMYRFSPFSPTVDMDGRVSSSYIGYMDYCTGNYSMTTPRKSGESFLEANGLDIRQEGLFILKEKTK